MPPTGQASQRLWPANGWKLPNGQAMQTGVSREVRSLVTRSARMPFGQAEQVPFSSTLWPPGQKMRRCGGSKASMTTGDIAACSPLTRSWTTKVPTAPTVVLRTYCSVCCPSSRVTFSTAMRSHDPSSSVSISTEWIRYWLICFRLASPIWSSNVQRIAWLRGTVAHLNIRLQLAAADVRWPTATASIFTFQDMGNREAFSTISGSRSCTHGLQRHW
mmetsp:Transcript_84364/g.239155  ORF Transcript_84364/g.239155 Transcript_84364/m.239155 type:complete len:217 (-) Transcript_84364:381-1031(-)